jgi:hypothetical protein
MPVPTTAARSLSPAVVADRRMDFFLVGAQKCATSWLFSCLQEHPQVSLPREKREVHYLGGAEVGARGEDWFFGQYAGDAGKVRGSVSVDYLKDRDALARVARDFPGAHFLVSLRDPVERAASAHAWLYRKGAIKSPTVEDALHRALKAANGDTPVEADLLDRGRYGAQLDVLLAAGAAARTMVIDYEYLRSHPRETLQRIFGFIGVDRTFLPGSFEARPKRSANLPWLTAIERRLAPRHKPVAKAMDVLNQALCELGMARRSSAVPQEMAAEVRRFLAADAARLSAGLLRLAPENVVGAPGFVERWGGPQS